MTAMDMFKATVLVMAFYAFAITMITYAIPDEALTYVDLFSESTTSINLETITEDVQDSLEAQTNIPVVDVGALVFYSGNILIDLIANFIFAVPQMIGHVVNALTVLFNLDAQLVVITELFAGAIVTAMYVIGLIQLLTGVRSGRLV